VQETRLTHLIIHLLMTATVFSLQVLKNIPMSVLYGIFLYMGVTSLAGNQFYERIHMMFMQATSKRYPKRHYNEPYIARAAMAKYTFYQLALFIMLYVVKSIKSIAIAFPIIIALCVPVRSYFMPKQFTPEELIFLDGDDDEIADLVKSIDDGGSEGEAEKAQPVFEKVPLAVEKAPLAQEGEVPVRAASAPILRV